MMIVYPRETPPHIRTARAQPPAAHRRVNPCNRPCVSPPTPPAHNLSGSSSIDYRIVSGSFFNPVVSVGVCYTAVNAAAGGLTTGWWAVVLECFSSHPL